MMKIKASDVWPYLLLGVLTGLLGVIACEVAGVLRWHPAVF